jgi:proteasome lid subunit RPN8/RPN11
MPVAQRAAIEEHGVATYPDECCGAMLGRLDAEERVLVRIEKLDNARTADRHAHNRFLITDSDYLRVERLATEEGLALLGFYHSHPDHPARPSGTDLANAFPWFSYVILAVAGGSPGDMTSWILAEDESGFLPEEITTDAAASPADPNQGGP